MPESASTFPLSKPSAESLPSYARRLRIRSIRRGIPYRSSFRAASSLTAVPSLQATTSAAQCLTMRARSAHLSAFAVCGDLRTGILEAVAVEAVMHRDAVETFDAVQGGEFVDQPGSKQVLSTRRPHPHQSIRTRIHHLMD